MNKNLQGLIPIVVGVTGHRDVPLSDAPFLEDATRNILSEMAGKTHHSPHILISCLAEGADRIAARCALEIGWMLGVVLPAPREIYERDFEEQSSKDEFSELLDAAEWVETTNSKPDGSSDYLAAGIRVMQQSQILIAFWDGKVNGLEGGTGDVVERFVSDIPDAGLGISGNTLPDARPVIKITTRRVSDFDYVSQELIGKIDWILPHPDGLGGEGERQRWQEIFRRIDMFNLDAINMRAASPDAIARSHGYLDGAGCAPISRDYMMSDNCGAMFALADALSTKAQGERDKEFFILAGFAAMAIFLEQLYSGPFPFPMILFTALALVVIAVIVFKTNAGKRIEDRYLDYRSLAEACRVQYNWRIAGVRASIADNFLLEQRDELEWIRQAIRTNELAEDVGERSDAITPDQFNRIVCGWIDDQRHYFIGTAGRPGGAKSNLNKSKDEVWSWRARTLFLGGVVSVLILALVQMVLKEYSPEISSPLAQWAGVAYGLLFSAAGLIKVYQKVNAFSEHSRSYRRSGLLMQRASKRLQRAIQNGDIKSAQAIVYETGCEALDENGDWLMLHRDRPVEVPLG